MVYKRNKYIQGKYKVRNPSKYVGDISNIIYRSGLELRVMLYLDNSDKVLSWASEEIVVPYRSIDGRIHSYYLDFFAKIKDNNNQIKSYLIEVKPKEQTIEPIKGRKRQETYLNEMLTYGKNLAKWDAATKYANSKGWQFKILTEEDIKG